MKNQSRLLNRENVAPKFTNDQNTKFCQPTEEFIKEEAKII